MTPWEAALGGKVKVPTLGGAVDLNIPAGARSGQKLRLKGRGLPVPKETAGDQFVVLQIAGSRWRILRQHRTRDGATCRSTHAPTLGG